MCACPSLLFAVNKRMDEWVRRERIKLPDVLTFHGSAFAVTYPAGPHSSLDSDYAHLR